MRAKGAEDIVRTGRGSWQLSPQRPAKPDAAEKQAIMTFAESLEILETDAVLHPP